MDFDASVVHLDGEAVVAVRGEVDVATSDALWETVEAAVSLSPHLVLDLSATTFLASAGLSVIVRAYRQLQAVGGSVVLRAPRPAALTTLRITGLDKLIEIEHR